MIIDFVIRNAIIEAAKSRKSMSELEREIGVSKGLLGRWICWSDCATTVRLAPRRTTAETWAKVYKVLWPYLPSGKYVPESEKQPPLPLETRTVLQRLTAILIKACQTQVLDRLPVKEKIELLRLVKIAFVKGYRFEMAAQTRDLERELRRELDKEPVPASVPVFVPDVKIADNDYTEVVKDNNVYVSNRLCPLQTNVFCNIQCAQCEVLKANRVDGVATSVSLKLHCCGRVLNNVKVVSAGRT